MADMIMLMLILILIVLGLMLTKLYLSFRTKTSEPGPNMPGPAMIPIIGNVMEVAVPKPHIHMTNLVKQYGSIYRLKLVDYYIVVVSDYEDIMDVLVHRGVDFQDRLPPSFRLQDMNKRFKVLSFGDKTNALHVCRKIVQSSLKAYGSGLEKVESVVTDMSYELFDVLEKQNGEPYDPRVSYKNFLMQVICYFVLGEYLSVDDHMYQELQRMERLIVSNIGNAGPGAILDMAPWIRFLGNTAWQNLCQAYKISKASYLHYKDNLIIHDSEDQPVLQRLLTAMKKQRDENGELLLDDTWGEGILCELFVAGLTTTSAALYTVTMVLAHYPHIQYRVKQEVNKLANNRKICLSDKDQLHYTRAFIFEVLRNASVVSSGLPHKATHDVQLKGFNVPKDTIVLCLQWAMHHDEQFWEAPYEYRPERFLDEHGELVPADHPNRRHLMPFGGGARVCVGQTFAMTRLLLTTAMLVQRFTIWPESNSCDPGICDPRGFEYGSTLYPLDTKVRFFESSTALPDMY